MRVVYQAYGGAAYRRQALFSALTLAHRDVARRARIAIYTDAPADFAGHGWDVVPLDPATIARWRGRFDFVHRLKLECLRDATRQFADAAGWLVMDADTVWRTPADDVADWLRAGRGVMHVREQPIGPGYHGAIHRALQRVEPASAHADMLNAGMIGVPPGGAGALDEALALTDRLLLACFARNWLEQAAVSVVMQRRFVVEFAAERVLHYWDLNREIDPALAGFFARHAGLASPALAAAAAAFDPVPEARGLQAQLRARGRSLADRLASLRRSWSKRRIDLRVLAARAGL